MGGKPNFFTKLANFRKLELPSRQVNKGYSSSSVYISRTSLDFLSELTTFTNLNSRLQQAKCYRLNPVLNAVLNVIADAEANKKWFVKDSKGELTPLKEYDSDGGVLKRLIYEPNPLQSGKELDKQFSINRNVFGNAYQYASIPIGFESNWTYEDVTVINNLPPARVCPKITGKWLDATTIDEIIKYYVFNTLDGKTRELSPSVIMHMNEANIDFDETFTEGVSKLVALQKPLSNIQLAYEARNVQIKRRGASGILTSDKQDAGLGSISLTQEEKEELQKEYRDNYGGLEGQNDIIISPNPMRYIDMSKKTRDLMLFEEVWDDAIAVCNAFGVEPSLVRYYIKKGGLSEETNAAEKRLYDSLIIPKSEEKDEKINNFLGLKEKGIELVGSYDHVKVLQKNQKEEAETKGINTRSSLEAFSKGALTYNEVLACMNMPENSEIGGNRVWDLDAKQLQAIGITINQVEDEPEDD